MTTYILIAWLIAACIATPIIDFRLRKISKRYPLAR